MKHKLLIFMTALAVTATAQSSLQLIAGNNATIAINSTQYLTLSPHTNLKFTIDIKNVGATTKTYTAKRIDQLLNKTTDTASAYFCFGGLCYGAETLISPNYVVLKPGAKASDTTAQFFALVADLDEAANIGCSEIRYTFYDVNNVNDSAQVTLKYNCPVTGIRSVNREAAAMAIFPNPASDAAVLRLQADEVSSAAVMIHNSLGQMVTEKPVTLREGANSIPLDIATLPTGIYFVSVKTNTATLTRKLIID